MPLRADYTELPSRGVLNKRQIINSKRLDPGERALRLLQGNKAAGERGERSGSDDGTVSALCWGTQHLHSLLLRGVAMVPSQRCPGKTEQEVGWRTA